MAANLEAEKIAKLRQQPQPPQPQPPQSQQITPTPTPAPAPASNPFAAAPTPAANPFAAAPTTNPAPAAANPFAIAPAPAPAAPAPYVAPAAAATAPETAKEKAPPTTAPAAVTEPADPLSQSRGSDTASSSPKAPPRRLKKASDLHLSNDELIAVMSKVREGKMTIDDALAEAQALEGKIAVNQLLKQYPDVQLTDAEQSDLAAQPTEHRPVIVKQMATKKKSFEAAKQAIASGEVVVDGQVSKRGSISAMLRPAGARLNTMLRPKKASSTDDAEDAPPTPGSPSSAGVASPKPAAGGGSKSRLTDFLSKFKGGDSGAAEPEPSSSQPSPAPPPVPLAPPVPAIDPSLVLSQAWVVTASSPSYYESHMLQVAAGEIVNVLDKKSDPAMWKCEYNGKIGYIKFVYLDEFNVKPSGSAALMTAAKKAQEEAAAAAAEAEAARLALEHAIRLVEELQRQRQLQGGSAVAAPVDAAVMEKPKEEAGASRTSTAESEIKETLPQAEGPATVVESAVKSETSIQETAATAGVAATTHVIENVE